jgi:mono/diheme cytochrome c family protein
MPSGTPARKRLSRLRLSSFAALLLAAPSLQAGEPPQPAAAAVKFFEERVRPVLAENCQECHGAQKQKGGLRLDSRAALLRGGDSGPAVLPGKPDNSLLIQAVRRGERVQMPPRRTLPPRAVADLAAWVRMGAPWPTDTAAVRNEPASGGPAFTAEEKAFWAFQTPVRPPVPAVRDAAWAHSPIDRFILAGLEAKGLRPAPPADKRTLLRRASFDLIGLPPTPEEINTFLADDTPDAFARVVERLLASPHYGERWGRHWLDVARYADSNGMDENLAYGNAWRYRDYVVAAFNKDKPYDQFVREQIAGDLLPAEGGEAAGLERLIATGFLSLGPKMLAEDDPVKMEMDIIDEQVDTVGRTFLGLTLGCARCHDHKFDPIPTADYYSLAGIFKSTRTMENFRVVARWQERPLGAEEAGRPLRLHEEKISRARAAFDRLQRQAKEDLPLGNALMAQFRAARRRSRVAADLQSLRAEIAGLAKTRPVLPFAMAVSESKPTNLRIHLRGNHLTLGREVPRRFPQVLAGSDQAPVGGKQSGRLELAQWLTRPDHPLTARVLVNRVWHWHFGQGLVPSTDNLGKLGERPSNQPLLDWLAVEFVARGWSVKELHRLILLSNTYQMSSAYDEKAALADPDCRLRWRRARQRLDAESLRDAILAVSGRLDRTMGGSLFTGANRAYVPGYPNSTYAGYTSDRRSLYLPVIRSDLYAVFQAFDFADPSVPNGERATTTVPSQALFMMNGDLVREQTRRLAESLLARPDLDDPGRVRVLYERAFGRPPTSAETARALHFVGRAESQWKMEKLADGGERRRRAWQGLCRVVLSANEFLHVE